MVEGQFYKILQLDNENNKNKNNEQLKQDKIRWAKEEELLTLVYSGLAQTLAYIHSPQTPIEWEFY